LLNVEGLKDVISALRGDDTYESALLQLAFAYRFQKMGAHISLEPAAARGRRGDISLLWQDQTYMVECYVPRMRTDQDLLRDVYAYSLEKVTTAASEAGKVIRALIHFTSYPDTSQRQEIEQATIRLIKDVPPRSSRRISVSCAEVEVQEITGQPDEDFLEDGTPNEHGPYFSLAGGVMVESETDVETILRPRGWWSPPMPKRSRVFWSLPPRQSESLADRSSDLSDRIAKRKLRQTRAEGGTAKRIVIAQIPEVREQDELARRVARGVQQRLMPRHEGIAVIILTARVWAHARRFRYLAYLLQGVDRDNILHEIYRKIGYIDFTFDVLHDWR
jgi:hypothetical protein